MGQTLGFRFGRFHCCGRTEHHIVEANQLTRYLNYSALYRMVPLICFQLDHIDVSGIIILEDYQTIRYSH